MVSFLLEERIVGQKERHNIFKIWGNKSYQLRIVYSVKMSFSNEGDIKVLSDEAKLECVTNTHTLREWLKKGL